MNLKIKWTPMVALSAAAIILISSIIGGLIYQQILVDEYRIKVHELLEEAKGIFEEIRGFTIEDVGVEVVTISWAKENWGEAIAEVNKEEILMEERIYKALYIIPENASLYDVGVEWSGMIAAAVWQDKIYIVKEYFDPSNKFYAEKMLIHELTHIMQGKYFAMEERALYDGEKAKSALIEGDARLMEEAYTNKTRESFQTMKTTITQRPARECGKISASIAATLPDSVSRLYAFPYEYGLKFVKALYEEGGWDAVNEAYMKMPTTTEQVIHPEKYFINESGKNTHMPEPSNKNWRKKKSDSYGEHFIFVMLGNWIPEIEASMAAEGWGGDNLTYYENGEEYLLTWNIIWDSSDDASEFTLYFRNMMEEAGSKELSVNFWYANGKFVSLTLKDATTLIVISPGENEIKDFTSLIETT